MCQITEPVCQITEPVWCLCAFFSQQKVAQHQTTSDIQLGPGGKSWSRGSLGGASSAAASAASRDDRLSNRYILLVSVVVIHVFYSCIYCNSAQNLVCSLER